MTSIGVLDYGAGNLGSVLRALQALQISARVVTQPQDFVGIDKIVFPGVGAAGQAMHALKSKQLIAPLLAHAHAGKPLMGICVGMQVLGNYSEEDQTPCLGLLPFELRKFSVTAPVPHMGWNDLNWNMANPASAKMSAGLSSEGTAYTVYYVHSYCVPCASPEIPEYVAATTTYSQQTFAGAVAFKNIWGTQFHTEKSGTTGLRILKNFVEL